jgi:hypothetical protein
MIAEIGFETRNLFFFANGAEVGGVRERALGSPTHPLAHRGACRRRAGRGSSAPPLQPRHPLRSVGPSTQLHLVLRPDLEPPRQARSTELLGTTPRPLAEQQQATSSSKQQQHRSQTADRNAQRATRRPSTQRPPPPPPLVPVRPLSTERP